VSKGSPQGTQSLLMLSIPNPGSHDKHSVLSTQVAQSVGHTINRIYNNRKVHLTLAIIITIKVFIIRRSTYTSS